MQTILITNVDCLNCAPWNTAARVSNTTSEAPGRVAGANVSRDSASRLTFVGFWILSQRKGIGELLSASRTEKYRELVSITRLRANQWAHHLECPRERLW
jgi:hypothetical protein